MKTMLTHNLQVNQMTKKINMKKMNMKNMKKMKNTKRLKGLEENTFIIVLMKMVIYAVPHALKNALFNLHPLRGLHSSMSLSFAHRAVFCLKRCKCLKPKEACFMSEKFEDLKQSLIIFGSALFQMIQQK